jgi:glucokinase
VGPTIGVDLGGTKLLAGMVAPDGTVLQRIYRSISGLPLNELLDLAEAAVHELDDDTTPVGFGIPSLIDRRTGVSVRCNHLPLDGVPFGALMAERLNRPVAVDNDANCAALAEWRHGAAKGTRHAVVLTLGTGIGGGLILNGALYHGAVGAAAELGHMVVDEDGPPCFGDCPGHGCLEALASGSALARDAKAAGLPPSGEEVTQLAEHGDAAALTLLNEIGTHLGAGIAGLAMIFNPEIVVVGGGVMAAGELILGEARAELARRAMEPSASVTVRAAHFREDAGMIGAAWMAA